MSNKNYNCSIYEQNPKPLQGAVVNHCKVTSYPVFKFSNFDAWCSSALHFLSGSYIVPFSDMHHSITAQGGHRPSGSSPASLRSSATTPCVGTWCDVKFLTAVPLSVCAQRSLIAKSAPHRSQRTRSKKRRAYPHRVLPSSPNPRRLCQVEEHGSGFVQGIDLL